MPRRPHLELGLSDNVQLWAEPVRAPGDKNEQGRKAARLDGVEHQEDKREQMATDFLALGAICHQYFGDSASWFGAFI